MTSSSRAAPQSAGIAAPFAALVCGAVAMGISPTFVRLAGGGALLAQSLQIRPGGAIGDAYGLVTGVFFGLYFLAVQAARRGSSAARVTFESSVITAALLLLVALVLEHQLLPQTLGGVAPPFRPPSVSPAPWQGLLAVAL